MKIKYILFSIIFFVINCYGQDDNIIGTWKVVAVDNGELYYDSVKDSLVIYDEFKGTFDPNEENVKELIRHVYISSIFIFNEQNEFIQKSDLYELKINYELDKNNNKLLLKEKDETQNFEIFYEFKNDFLFIEINIDQPILKFKLYKVN